MSLTSEGNTVMTLPVTPAANAGCGNGMGNMWGGDGAIWLIILFLIWGNNGWGGNNWGNGGAGMQGALTRSDLCQDMNFNNLESAVRNISDSVNVGFSNLNSTICHQQYDTAMLVNGVNNNLSNGFAGLNNAVCTLGYQNAQLINGVNTSIMQAQNAIQTQAADCCCRTQTNLMQLGNEVERGFCQTSYNDQANTTAIIQNAHNDTDRVLARLDAMEMSRKDETIANLRQQLQTADFQASQQAQNNYLVNQLRPCPVPSYITCNPWASQAPYGSCGSYNNGCGCGCG